MRDETTVKLTLLASQFETANAILRANNEFHNGNQFDFELVELDFYNINDGVLTSQEALEKAGIAYDLWWGNGNSYSASTRYIRFTEAGELLELCVLDENINPDLSILKQLLDTPDELRASIVKFIADTEPLPWDNQAEYGKLYQMMQLIAPTPIPSD